MCAYARARVCVHLYCSPSFAVDPFGFLHLSSDLLEPLCPPELHRRAILRTACDRHSAAIFLLSYSYPYPRLIPWYISFFLSFSLLLSMFLPHNPGDTLVLRSHLSPYPKLKITLTSCPTLIFSTWYPALTLLLPSWRWKFVRLWSRDGSNCWWVRPSHWGLWGNHKGIPIFPSRIHPLPKGE